jgi:hypothetical protein
MLGHYHANPRLHTVRIPRRCYTLLHDARIAPENLSNLYQTYRLPRDPFFPLFLACKRGYLAERERVRQARREYILTQVRSMPEPRLRTLRYLGYFERGLNSAGDSPVWQDRLFPGSKKQADAYLGLSEADWQSLIRTHMRDLCSRYPRLKPSVTDLIAAQSVLELLPDVRSLPESARPAAPVPPAAQSVRASYRRLSLLHHPDRGGDPELFIQIKRAHDQLLGL